jgi:mono/diheme cytochrome c family protein
MKSSLVRIGQKLILACAVILFVGVCARADDSAGLYKAKCAACHAPDGSGNVPMGKQLGAKDLGSSEVQSQTDAQLIGSITNGMGKKMPAYKGKLTDGQIKGLVGFIRGLAAKK